MVKSTRLLVLQITASVVVSLPVSAFAALGGTPSGTDDAAVRAARIAQGRMGQTGQSALASSGVRQVTYRKDTGTVINEYLNAQGVVFAVTWDGPVRPDLAALTGGYASELHSAMKRERLMRQANVTHGRLSIASSGRMHDFRGRVIALDLLPSNVSAEALQ